MTLWLDQLDTQLFLFLNGLHAPWLDSVMEWITRKQSWYPFYGLLLAVLIWKLKKKAIPVVLLIVLAIVLSDQVTSSILKPWAARLRPCHEPSIQHLVHLTGSCGGEFGFASSHAANSFALATLLFLLLPHWRKWTGWLFLWAVVVSYSRIYVGVHYPLDVLAGAAIGTLVAVGLAWVGNKYLRRMLP